MFQRYIVIQIIMQILVNIYAVQHIARVTLYKYLILFKLLLVSILRSPSPFTSSVLQIKYPSKI